MLSEPEFPPDDTAGNSRPKKASLRRNVVTNYLVVVVLVAVGFVTTPILTHQLGILRYGVWALIGSLIPFLELLELGFAGATVAFVSRHLELEDDDKVRATLNTSFLCPRRAGNRRVRRRRRLRDLPPRHSSRASRRAWSARRGSSSCSSRSIWPSPSRWTRIGGALCALQRFDLLNYSLITVTVSQAIGWVIVLVAPRRTDLARCRHGRDQPGGSGVAAVMVHRFSHGSISPPRVSTAASCERSPRHRAGTP